MLKKRFEDAVARLNPALTSEARQDAVRRVMQSELPSLLEEMGDDKLKLIAHELLMSLRENVSVDWAHRDSARARMRVLVKRILRKYGYPPDLQDTAVQTVLQQAEALSFGWSMPRIGSGGGNG